MDFAVPDDGGARKLALAAMNDGDASSEDDDSDDPDVVADPLNALDLERVLADHFRSFAALPCFPGFVSQLGAAERRCLERVLHASQ